MLVLGVGDAFSARWYSSCLALEAEGTWLLIDCPHPIRKILREAGQKSGVPLDVGQFSGLVLTHLHADHSSGVEGLAFYARYLLRDRRPALLAHPDVLARLWDHHLAGSMEWSIPAAGQPANQRRLADFSDARPLDEAGPVQLGPFAVECRRTIHSIPTFALRIRAGGRCVGCSADTAFDPNLIQWLAAADLIVHETGGGSLHTPYERLAAQPEELRARMRLIHYPDDFDAERSVIEPLHQGALYEI